VVREFIAITRTLIVFAANPEGAPVVRRVRGVMGA
jgi:hypothetical protein